MTPTVAVVSIHRGPAAEQEHRELLRDFAEAMADRDHYKRQRDALLEAIRKHKAALPKGDWKLSDEDEALYEVARQIEGKGGVEAELKRRAKEASSEAVDHYGDELDVPEGEAHAFRKAAGLLRDLLNESQGES